MTALIIALLTLAASVLLVGSLLVPITLAKFPQLTLDGRVWVVWVRLASGVACAVASAMAVVAYGLKDHRLYLPYLIVIVSVLTPPLHHLTSPTPLIPACLRLPGGRPVCVLLHQPVGRLRTVYHLHRQ